jgi:predicted permease
VNAFHVCGALLAIWALVVAVLGITREGFPASDRAARAVGAVSVVLTLLAIGTAIYTGAAEEEEHPEGGDEAALVRPL